MTSPPHRLRLKPLEIAGLPRFIEVPEEGITFGRDSANQVVLDPERFPYISAHHARINRDGETLIIEDLESKNGTILNGNQVQRSEVKPGDVIVLGSKFGARFLVVAGMSTTQTLDLEKPIQGPSSSLGASTIIRLKKALGITDHADDIGRMARSNKRRIIVMVGFVAVLAFCATYAIVRLELSRRQGLEGLEKFLAATTEKLRKQQREWEEQKAGLEAERDILAKKLRSMDENGRASAGEIKDLRQLISRTDARLEKFNPVKLEKVEKTRRRKLEQVLASIVYVEKKIAFREKDGDRYLHTTGSPGPRIRKPEGRKDLHFDAAESGSGFCVSRKGWVLTNAHVVAMPKIRRPLVFNETVLVLEPILDVIFSGTSVRHSVKVIRSSEEDSGDLAVLKLEPFEGMPYIEDFDPDVGRPEKLRL